MNNKWLIAATDKSEVTRFAVDEFARLLKKVDSTAVILKNQEVGEGVLKIGLFDGAPVPVVENPALDDAIAIDVSAASGYITGSNERSVLIAVYRFFTEIGGVFVRPGRDGELMPTLDSGALCVKLTDRAAMRYRGFCYEGSAGYEHVIDLIDFAPKLGMNITFTQLWRPTFMLDRWYGNERNPAYTPAKLSHGAQDVLVSEYDRAATLRGLNNHKMGHGWIPSIIGEKSGVWHGISDPAIVTDENRHLIAEIGGERKLYLNSAVDTSFCYGNPEARKLIVESVVKYAEEHPEVDHLHFWLADMPNNQCECELCRDTLPSDFYVDMLNALDEALTERKISTRIVFLSYLELLWTPERARIKNPERFMLIFAPIRRPYHRPFTAQTEGEIPKFERNKWVNSCSNYSVLNHLKMWQEQFPGECILFDYHLMWDCYNDITGIKTGAMLGLDMAELPKSKLLGNISCQGVRFGILGALPMRLMASAMWSGVTNAERETEEYYSACFGEESAACRAVLDAVLEALDPDMLRGVKPIPKNYPELVSAAKQAIADIAPTVDKHRYDECFSRRVSFLYFAEQLRLADTLMDFVAASSVDDDPAAKSAWAKTLTTIAEIEALYPKSLDSFEFSLVWHRHVITHMRPSWKIDYDSGELTM